MQKIINTILTVFLICFFSCKDESDKTQSFPQDLEGGMPLYLDPGQKIEDRVSDLMSRMTLEEKVGQMCQYVGVEHLKESKAKALENNQGIDENDDAHGIYPFSVDSLLGMVKNGKIGSFLHVLTAEEANMLQEVAMNHRLKIPLLIGIDAIHGNALYKGATVFPTPIGMASTFDDKAVELAGEYTAKEMRATGSHWAFTPNVDVARDPRWGRVGETFGEDPYLVARMGVAHIKGMQQEDFTGNEKVIACAKHLIAGSDPINGTNASPMDVSMRTIREVYLPPYKAAVEEANVFSIMTAHNELNGIPCHAHKGLMEDILRDEYGFSGFYVSDWMDIERIDYLHHTAKDFKEAVYQSVSRGMDMHMHGPHFYEAVIELVKEGKIEESRVDEACSKILEAKFRLGLFENPYVDIEASEEVVFSKAHTDLALDIARKSIVLLKNDEVLPLEAGKYKKIFVTGPNANNQATLGDWAKNQPEEKVVTVLEGLQAAGDKHNIAIDYYESGWKINQMDDEKIVAAGNRAKKADLAIVVVGGNSLRDFWKDKTAGENTARAEIDLAGKQLELIKRVYNSGTPTIVILVNGRPIGEPWVEENIPAIIEAWEPGSYGGTAIAEVLFGDVNPSGKLPVTILRHVGQVNLFYNHKPSHYFHKYIDLDHRPLYEFGHGLSYTNFEYSELSLKDSVIAIDGSTEVTVTITNTGEKYGEEVAQMYIRDDVSSATRPVKELKGYKRVALKPGESQKVTFKIEPSALAFFDIDMNYVVEPGDFTIMAGGSSSDKNLKKITLKVKQ